MKENNKSESKNAIKRNIVLGVLPVFMVCLALAVRYSNLPYTPFEGRYHQLPYASDSFSYIRSMVVVVMAIIVSMGTVMSILTGKLKAKLDRTVWFLIGFGLLCVVSLLMSPFKALAVSGASDSYEGIGVWISYVLIALMFYVVSKSDTGRLQAYKKGAVAVIAIQVFFGVFQRWGINPLEWNVFRFLVLPQSFDAQGQIFKNTLEAVGTMGNSNYIGSVLGLTAPFLICNVWNQSKLKKIFTIAMFAGIHLLLLSSESLSGLLFVPFLYWMPFWTNEDFKKLYLKILHPIYIGVTGVYCFIFVQGIKEIVATTILHLVVVYVMLIFDHFKVNKKVRLTVLSFCIIVIGIVGVLNMPPSRVEGAQYLTKLEAKKDQIEIETGRYSIKVLNDHKMILIEDGDGKAIEVVDNKELISAVDEQYEGLSIQRKQRSGFDTIEIMPFHAKFFVLEDRFEYINSGLKADKIQEQKLIGPKGYERLGSGRMYIWQATGAVLGDRFLIGTGPDTLVARFPQNAVVGNYNFSGYASYITDKAHNLYLQIAIGFGALGLIVFLTLNFYVIKNGCKVLDKRNYLFNAAYFSIIAYLCVGLFNNSRVAFSPYYWILMGLVLGMENNESVKIKDI